LEFTTNTLILFTREAPFLLFPSVLPGTVQWIFRHHHGDDRRSLRHKYKPAPITTDARTFRIILPIKKPDCILKKRFSSAIAPGDFFYPVKENNTGDS